jgi:ATP/maltotriose-dependent transcriptional regulator MalT
VGTFGEPVSHAHLDLAELALRRGALDDAQAHVKFTDERIADHHTMAWHQRQRVLLMRSRCAHAAGDFDTAMSYAEQSLHDAERRGTRRYLVLADVQRATTAAAMGHPLDQAVVATTLAELSKVAGLEAWLLIADLAACARDDRWWSAAESAAVTFAVAAARDSRTDGTALREFITGELSRRRSAAGATRMRRRR